MIPFRILILAAFLAPAAVFARTPTERELALFRQGNEAYEASNFDAAAGAYGELLTLGLESRDLYYNAANANLKAGHLGRAILNYRKALRIDPKDEDAKANLAYARRHTKDVTPQDVPDPLPWLTALRPGAERAAWLFTLALNLAVCAFAARRFLRRPPAFMGPLTIGLGIAAVTFGLLFYIELREDRGVHEGVILVEQAPVRIGPGDDYTMAFVVHEGTETALGRTTSGWTEITVSPELKGWVASGAVESIE